MATFVAANQDRLNYLIDEAHSFIRNAASKFPEEQIVISFSGGKDSTVTADLVVRALSNPSLVHIFGDTTLEFPTTIEYARRFRESHPDAIFQIAKNEDQNFYDVCEDIGPPARMMRWCCSMFKTGPITRVINSLYRSQQILTFYGIRKSESVSRSKDIFDFAVFAGHKTLLGPTGISGFVMNPSIKLVPVFFGGTGFDSANQDMPDSLPERFEFGTLNSVGLAGLNASAKWILQQGITNLEAVEKANRVRLLTLLRSYDFISIIGDANDKDYVGIVSCVIDGISSDTAGQIFSDRNISVRTGLHCAPLAHKFLKTYPSGTIRFSVNCFTSKDDFAALEEALDEIKDNL